MIWAELACLLRYVTMYEINSERLRGEIARSLMEQMIGRTICQPKLTSLALRVCLASRANWHLALSLVPEFLALKLECRILGHSSNPVCAFSMMEQVGLCAVWKMENWLDSSVNLIQGWITVWESYSRALEQGSRIGSLVCSFGGFEEHENWLEEGWKKETCFPSRSSLPSIRQIQLRSF